MSANILVPDIKIYIRQECPYCIRACELLASKNVSFEIVDLTNKQKERAILQEQTNMKTVPQIFINQNFIGGCSELLELDKLGRLDLILSYKNKEA